MENCYRIKYRTGRLTVGEENVRGTWEDYFEDIYKEDSEKQNTV